jgi:hypothetical protein
MVLDWKLNIVKAVKDSKLGLNFTTSLWQQSAPAVDKEKGNTTQRRSVTKRAHPLTFTKTRKCLQFLDLNHPGYNLGIVL